MLDKITLILIGAVICGSVWAYYASETPENYVSKYEQDVFVGNHQFCQRVKISRADRNLPWDKFFMSSYCDELTDSNKTIEEKLAYSIKYMDYVPHYAPIK